jgi:hypothetical protein
MTIEQLLNCDVDELEQMTDEELNKHFAPYLVVCSPPEKEHAVVNINKPKRKKHKTKNEALNDQMKELAELHNVSLENVKLPKNLQ